MHGLHGILTGQRDTELKGVVVGQVFKNAH